MTDKKVKEPKSAADKGTELWSNTSNKESAAADALRRASRTVAETYKNTHCIRDPTNNDRRQNEREGGYLRRAQEDNGLLL